MTDQDAVDRILALIERGKKDPAFAIGCLEEVQSIAMRLSAAPYSASKMFLPGMYLPCTEIIEVDGIPDIAPNTFANNIKIKINTPGVVVGLMGATGPLGDFAERNAISYQLTIEEQKSFVSNGESVQGSYASFAGFAPQAPWNAVMLPVRGNGGWSLSLRNTSATLTIKPIFNLALLQGTDALFCCFPKYQR